MHSFSNHTLLLASMDAEFDDGLEAHAEFLDSIGVEDYFSRVYAGREKGKCLTRLESTASVFIHLYLYAM